MLIGLIVRFVANCIAACGNPAALNLPFIPARESHRRNNPPHPPPPSTYHLFSHARLPLAAVLCVHPVYYVLTLNILTRAQRVPRSLSPNPPLPPCDFHGGNILRSESEPSFEDEGNRVTAKGTFRFSTFDTDGLETKFRFDVGIKEDL